jgi:secondary thiamine-phosphate synthase enzyme
MSYLAHLYKGSDDMPAHIKAAVLPTFLTSPLHEGQLALGRWQGIYLVEHRAAPHKRRVFASVLRDQLPAHL